jgi:hypothetical protein
MKNILLVANTLLILALGAGLAFVYERGRRGNADRLTPQSASAANAATAAPADTGALDALLDRVEALERRVESLGERAVARSGSGAPRGEETDEGAQPQGPDAPAGEGTKKAAPLSEEEVRKLAKKQIEEEMKKAREQWRQSTRRQKKSLREIAKEIKLTAHQETEVDRVYREFGRDIMKVLFDVKDDAGLEDLKTQLSQCEYDKDLRDRLREQAATNYTVHGQKVSLLYVKLDSELRKSIPSETVAKLYRYDVELENPEFPDIERMFWGSTEEGDEEGKEGEKKEED